MSTPIQVFGPLSRDITSQVIEVKKQLTLVGFDFDVGDEVSIEIVEVEAVPPDLNCCLPSVNLPAVKRVIKLVKECKEIKLTSCNPVLIIDYLQGFSIRLVRKFAGTTRVTIRETDTQNVSAYLRGDPDTRTKTEQVP